MSLQKNNSLHAAGSIVGATGAATGQGFANVHTGAGVQTITLQEGIDEAECSIVATLKGGVTSRSLEVTHTSDTVKVFSSFNAAGAATDLDFSFVIVRHSG